MNLSPDPRRQSRVPRALIALWRRVQLSAEGCDLADDIDSWGLIPAAVRRFALSAGRSERNRWRLKTRALIALAQLTHEVECVEMRA